MLVPNDLYTPEVPAHHKFINSSYTPQSPVLPPRSPSSGPSEVSEHDRNMSDALEEVLDYNLTSPDSVGAPPASLSAAADSVRVPSASLLAAAAASLTMAANTTASQMLYRAVLTSKPDLARI